jgi:hypothetical protein
MISPVVLCGRKNWSLTLRKERKVRILENSVLRKIYEPNRADVVEDWRRVLNDKLQNLNASPSLLK